MKFLPFFSLSHFTKKTHLFRLCVSVCVFSLHELQCIRCSCQKKNYTVKRDHMNADVVKQFHSFTDTKPNQIFDEEKKKTWYYSSAKKFEIKYLCIAGGQRKIHTRTHPFVYINIHSRAVSFSYRFDAKHVCAINNAKNRARARTHTQH